MENVKITIKKNHNTEINEVKSIALGAEEIQIVKTLQSLNELLGKTNDKELEDETLNYYDNLLNRLYLNLCNIINN